jgi:zeaxanthin glucosyltransferase
MTKMPRVLLLPYHGTGHFNAFFNLAHTLNKRDYEVCFGGFDFFNTHVQAQGFSFFSFRSVPFGSDFERWVNEMAKAKSLYLAELKDRFTDRIYKHREQELFSLVNQFNPTVVLIDAMQATDFIILYCILKAKKINVAIVHTMLPPAITEGKPPLNSDLFPEDKIGFAEAVKIINQQRRKKALKQNLKFFGMDDSFIIRRRIKKNNVPDQYRGRELSLLNFSVRNIDQFVLAPREFDFPNPEESGQHYMGFLKNHIRYNYVDRTYLKNQQSILGKKERFKKKVVYCAFGTISPEEGEDTRLFLQKLITVATTNKYILIISSKTHCEFFKSKFKEEDLYIFQSVPQRHVLSYADVFVTHGGLNSIQESIEAGVPMLVCPVHKHYDAQGNAARVVYHELGLRADIGTDGPKELEKKLKTLLENPQFRINIDVLRKKNTAYAEENFLNALHNLQSLT